MRPWFGIVSCILATGVLSCSKSGDPVDPSGAGKMSLGDGGYVTSGRWKGYAWTTAIGDGSRVAPSSFANLKAGATRLCVQGAVGRDSAFRGLVLLGMNLSQEALPPAGSLEPAIQEYSPGGSGVRFQVSNPAGSDLRIQIQDRSGLATGRWCASLAGRTSGTIPWSEFNTKCWAPATGTTYGHQALTNIGIVVPGKDVQDVPVDFCLEDLAESP
ncbi:MAG: hypothetical protein IPO40_08795 [Fibrobacteres bacterium]|nr:hypothetical protein [Fibrobacterota bacterium]